ncbi:MAG: peptide ABC transporter substrate-binding protein [Planctomycetota bacterium]
MLKLAAPFLALLLLVGITVVSDRPQPPADLTFVNRGDVNTLDLQRMSWMQDLRVARILFEGLVQNDVFTHGYDIAPAVAERWEISEDGKTYTFFLREDAKWSNGDAVTAHDFIYSWRRALLPDVAADYVAMFFFIEGGEDFYNWRTDELAKMSKGESSYEDGVALWAETERRFEEMVALDAIDDRTLTFTLRQRVPYYLDLCAFAVFYPVYPPLVSQYERPDPVTGRLNLELGWTKPPTLVTNGPFMLTRWRFKRDMRFEQNPHWWNRESLNIRSIEIPSVNDPNAAILAYRTGTVDWVSDVTPHYRGDMIAQKQQFYEEHAEQVASLRALGLDQFEVDRRLPNDPRAHVHAVPAFGTYWWNFNCKPTLPDGRDNPFHDPRVRRAFAMCVDKNAVTEQVRRLGEPVADSLIPPGSIGGYTPPAGLTHLGRASDEAGRQAIAAEARALLAEAGYTDPSRFITVELLFNKDSGHDLIAQSLAKTWQQYLGVPVSLAQKEIKVFRDDLKKANYMTGRAGWYGDYGDPTTFLYVNKTGDGNNDRKYSDPVYDKLLEDAELQSDPAERMRMLERAEAIIMNETLPMVPLFHYATIYMFDAHKLTGVTAHPRTKQNIYLLDILGDGVGTDEIKALPLRVTSGDGRGVVGAEDAPNTEGEAPPEDAPQPETLPEEAPA